MYVSIFEEVYTERGIERGREEGVKTKAVEMSKKLLSHGVSPEIIAESSGLSPEEVRSLMS
jgi:predicted transposase/invertase (TIGR01784 family)